MIAFTNPGLIDLDAALIMGVNVKVTDHPTGYFGTGLKYAIATLLRNGCSITIYRGSKRHEIGVEALASRGKTFDVVTLDNHRLGFTTDLGKNWEPWQAFRELYTNAKDEGGKVFRQDSTPADTSSDISSDTTMILVEGKVIESAYDTRGAFLIEGTPDIVTEAVDIYTRPAIGIFYRGILVFKNDSTANMQFTYNIKRRVMLSEDRSACYEFQLNEAIAAAVDELADRGERDLVAQILCPPKNATFERNINYNGVYGNDTRSAGFIEIVGELIKTRALEMAESAKTAFARLSKTSEEPIALTQMSAIRKQQLARAVEFCKALGHPVDDYPIVCVERMAANNLGLAKNGKIYISAMAFEQGTKIIAGTLLEEFFHLRNNLYDETRDFQNFLLDRIVSMGEEYVWKEPL